MSCHPSTKRTSIPLPQLFSRCSLLSTIIFLALPAFVGLPSNWGVRDPAPTAGGDASPVAGGEAGGRLQPRMDSPADVCVRWSQQSTLVNDTIYIYGGQAKTSSSQDSDTWNNYFLTLDIGSDWDTGSVTPTGLPEPASPPNGPPAVANGYLWTNDESIWLYGGLFSDSPPTDPTAFSLWEYDISSKTWSDVTDQTTISSDSGSKEIQRAAEGAGISVKNRGLGYYFGGHLDGYTTQGWSQSIPRVYLKSMLEFDMNSKTFNNHTGGGLEKAGVPERADGILVFVPWGSEGILLAIGGGTNSTFSQMNIIDIYDLRTQTWSKQSTAGSTPKYRVNPCAVVASAPDASSHNVYFFGGQDLLPYGNQTQYDDMWILTVPSFTWIKVDDSDQNVPPARAGHTCEIAGEQMVVIGGYVGTELSCDSPGVYVFNLSSLEWKTQYAAMLDDDDGSASKAAASASVSAVPTQTPGGAYKVPQSVVDVVGGGADGGATVTRPAKSADPDSPVATGEPGDYKYTTVTAVHASTSVSTAANGQVITTVTTPTSGASSGSGGGSGDGSSKKGNSIAAIVGGVVGGISFLALVLLVIAYSIYRRKIRELRESAQRLAEANGYADAGKESRDESDRGPIMIRREDGSTADLMLQGEPSFWGVLLSPRRSLRVVNH